MTPGINVPHPLGHADAQPQRRVHRDTDADKLRAGEQLLVELGPRDVQRDRCKPRALKESQRQSKPQRLVAQLVAGDQNYRAWLTHGLGYLFATVL